MTYTRGSLTYNTLFDRGQHYGHLRGAVTITPFADRLAMELSLSVLSRLGIEPRSPACEANALPLRHRGGRVV